MPDGHSPRHVGRRTRRQDHGNGFHSQEIIAIALAQREDRAAGAEDLLPEVGEGSGLCLCIDLDDFLRVDERGEGEDYAEEG